MFDRYHNILARLRAPLLLALAIGLAWLVFESIAYRSGAYFRIAEPDSNTGAVVTALQVLEREHRPQARNILVFGDSRVGEGFSPQRAAAGDPRFNFINLAVPASTARTWYYLLRAIDRRGYTYDAVVVGTLYRSTHAELLADWPIDAAHAAGLVGLRDGWSFPATFQAPAQRDRARYAALLPALNLRQDTQALLEAPLERFTKIVHGRPAYLDALRVYAGREEEMPVVEFSASSPGKVKASVIDWGNSTPAQRLQVAAILSDSTPRPPAMIAGNDAFLGRWLGSMARITQRRGALLIVYPLPRGPYRVLFGTDSRLPPALEALRHRSQVMVLPPGLLAELESPQFFFDPLHANRAGRERTGSVVGARVRGALTQGAAR